MGALSLMGEERIGLRNTLQAFLDLGNYLISMGDL